MRALDWEALRPVVREHGSSVHALEVPGYALYWNPWHSVSPL